MYMDVTNSRPLNEILSDILIPMEIKTLSSIRNGCLVGRAEIPPPYGCNPLLAHNLDV